MGTVMTFEELMEQRGGYWDAQYAMIPIGQYVKCVAIGTVSKYELTEFGSSLLAVGIAQGSSVVVTSGAKRAPRKPKVQSEAPVADGNGMDDL
jgi:hypothetical protein